MGTRNVPASSVLFTTTTTGTGTYAVATGVTGYMLPENVWPSLNGARVGYVAVDSLTSPTIREEGEGVLSSGAPWTLTRATIRRSLSGGVAGGSAINWAAGTKYVFLTPLPAQLLLLDTDGWLHVPGDLVLASNGVERLRVSSSGAWTVASPASARSALAAPATPNGVPGTVGEWREFASIDGGNLDTPAGGTWAYFGLRFVTATGIWDGNAAHSVAAGGTTIAAGVAGRIWRGFCWRVA